MCLFPPVVELDGTCRANHWPAYRTDVSSKSNVVSSLFPQVPTIAPTIYFENEHLCTYRWRFFLSSPHTPHIGAASPPQAVPSHSRPTQSPRSHRRRFKVDPIVTHDTSLFLGTRRHPTPTPNCLTQWQGHSTTVFHQDAPVLVSPHPPPSKTIMISSWRLLPKMLCATHRPRRRRV